MPESDVAPANASAGAVRISAVERTFPAADGARTVLRQVDLDEALTEATRETR